MAGGSRYSSRETLKTWPNQKQFWNNKNCVLIHMKQYYAYISLPIPLSKYPHSMITSLNMNISKFRMFLQYHTIKFWKNPEFEKTPDKTRVF